jgi:hypothetical protein
MVKTSSILFIVNYLKIKKTSEKSSLSFQSKLLIATFTYIYDICHSSVHNITFFSATVDLHGKRFKG